MVASRYTLTAIFPSLSLYGHKIRTRFNFVVAFH